MGRSAVVGALYACVHAYQGVYLICVVHAMLPCCDVIPVYLLFSKLLPAHARALQLCLPGLVLLSACWIGPHAVTLRCECASCELALYLYFVYFALLAVSSDFLFWDRNFRPQAHTCV